MSLNSGVQKIRVLRNYGSKKKYYNEVIGYNNCLDELQGAFLRVKLRHIDAWTEQRKQIAKWYNEALAGVTDIVTPFLHENASHSYHLYVIRTPKRSKLQEKLAEKGIGSLIHYPIPPHLQRAYSNLGYKKGDFPITEELSDSVLSLSLWVGMDKTIIDRVVQVAKDFGS